MKGPLLSEDTRVVVQGITGTAARLHTRIMKAYGTRVVAGARPGGGGRTVEGVPVFDTVAEAMAQTGANASVLFVPARAIRGAAMEALHAGVDLLVMVPEHVPLHDTLAIVERSRERGIPVVGPNTPGLIRPSVRCKLGFLPERYFTPGEVAIVSRSGTLHYELARRLTAAGIGQSTCIGVGGDGVVGFSFSDAFELLDDDPDTRAVLMVGEIGGTLEEDAAALKASGRFSKPVVAFLAGRNAPPEKRMGHAGAIVAGGKGTIDSKLCALAAAHIPVADLPGDVVGLVREALA